MSKRISLETKLIFAVTVVLLLIVTASVGVSVFSERENINDEKFIVSGEAVTEQN